VSAPRLRHLSASGHMPEAAARVLNLLSLNSPGQWSFE
jgi:hypothetical protein